MKTFLTILFFSCTIVLQAQDSTSEIFKLKQDVHLVKKGQKMHFQEVVSDSRCPSDVTCIMAGWAIVKINLIENENKNLRVVEIKIPAGIITGTEPVLFESAKGKMLVTGLMPYPVTTTPFEERDYCLELRWIPN